MGLFGPAFLAVTVFFIGAGPGSPDLLTIRARDRIRMCPVVLYAGSLVPEALVLETKDPQARVCDTSGLTLPQILCEIEQAHQKGHHVARLHSGDPSLYGAIGEQIAYLKRQNIPFEIIPGVPAYAAAAARLGLELTRPSVSQTVILTRTAMRSSSVPETEALEELGRTRATLALHLSITNLANIQKQLIPFYGADCPVIIAYRVSWPDEAFLYGTLETIRKQVKSARLTRTCLILIGQALAEVSRTDAFEASRLYDPGHTHLFRRGGNTAESSSFSGSGRA